MTNPDPAFRNISDTARWAAVYRAMEHDRPDALFRDPFARRLAGTLGVELEASIPEESRRQVWAWVSRTYLFDLFITRAIVEGADLVVNLAAGLDARPYRMTLPATLQWVEVDLPGILAYKTDVLADEEPRCALERVALDLADVEARRELFARLGRRSRKALVITEGLLMYLTRDQVGILADGLAAEPSVQSWVLDLGSPGLLKLLQQQVGERLAAAGAPFHFAPEEGPDFFTFHGWRVLDVRSMLKTAAALKRLSGTMRWLALIPASNGRQGARPWAGVVFLGRP